MFDDDDRTRDWAGGGGWQPDDSPPPSDPPKPPPPPQKKPAVKMSEYRAKVARGLVAGRFLPLHIGHEHLIEVARRSSEELDVVVFGSPADSIPSSTRVGWIRDAFPGVTTHETVATGDFAASIKNATKRLDYDVFYGGEIAAGLAAAKSIGATFVPVDPAREAFPISGSKIREDVMKYFNGIASIARPCFVRRVAIIGAESTGKTELCKRLAEIYSTRFVPEPARALAEARWGTIDPDAIELWVRTQIASEEAVARRANRVLFADTHATTAALWSYRLFDAQPKGFQHHTAKRPYDLVILCGNEVPFVGIPERDNPDLRRDLTNDLLDSSKNDHRVWLHGESWEARLLEARKAVDQLLLAKDFLSKRGALIVSGATPG